VHNINSTLVHVYNGFVLQHRIKYLSNGETSIINESQICREKLSSDKSVKRFWNTFHLQNCYIKLITIALKRCMQYRRVSETTFRIYIRSVLNCPC